MIAAIKKQRAALGEIKFAQIIVLEALAKHRVASAVSVTALLSLSAETLAITMREEGDESIIKLFAERLAHARAEMKNKGGKQ